MAVGEACLIPASYSLLGDLFDGTRRGRAAGVMSVGMALGNGLSMVVSGLLIGALDPATIASLPAFVPHVEWRLVFIIVGLAGLPVMLLLLSVREPRRMGVAVAAAPAPVLGCPSVPAIERRSHSGIVRRHRNDDGRLVGAAGVGPDDPDPRDGHEPRQCRIQHGHERADRRGDRAIADGLRE